MKKIVYGYFIEDIGEAHWKKDFMLYGGWSGFKVYSPDENLIGKTVTKGSAIDMARAHKRWSDGTEKAEDKVFIEFFKMHDIWMHDKTCPGNREKNFKLLSGIKGYEEGALMAMTKEHELKEKGRISKILREEYGW